MSIEITTKPHVEKFHYKALKEGSKGFESLKEMVDAGKLSMDEITVETNDDGVQTWKRNSEEHTFNVPVVNDLLVDGALTPAQEAHLQALITDRITSKNREAIDNREHDKLKTWEQVLSEEYTQRKAATTVSKEQLAEAVEVLRAALTELGMKEAAINAICDAAGRKFNAQACAVFMRNAGALEKIQSAVEKAYEQIADTEYADSTAPAFSLWLNNIDKVLAKDDELDADAFAI